MVLTAATGMTSYISEPERGRRDWEGKENARRATYANRRRIKGKRGKDLARLAVPSGRHPIGEMTSGILRGIEDGWFIGEIADAAFSYQQALEKGDKRQVGVNVHAQRDAEEERPKHDVPGL